VGERSEEGVCMVALAATEAEREVVYDIALHQRLPDSLRSEFPAMMVRTTGAQTALRLHVEEPAQLDALLQKLRSVGVVLTGLHLRSELEPERAGGATYEVWVAGELGESLLRYLRCPHYVVPEQTQVRLAVGSTGLQRFLRACTSCGAGIARVRRVGPVAQPNAGT
jgi:hypothetical protein